MKLQQLLNAGICFDYCPDACVPEIPYVQDVLFALTLAKEDKCYRFCTCNHITYVRNVHMVASAVAYDVLGMENYDRVRARKIIARAIVVLCPDEAQCVKFHKAYELAVREADGNADSHDPDTCPGCLARGKAEREQELREEIAWRARNGD